MSIELPEGPKSWLVVTGNKREFEELLSKVVNDKYKSNQFIYVDNRDNLRGQRGSPILLYGTYTKRKDWGELSLVLRAMDCPVKFLKGLQNEC